jgi:hypothetical protein
MINKLDSKVLKTSSAIEMGEIVDLVIARKSNSMTIIVNLAKEVNRNQAQRLFDGPYFPTS